MTRSGERRLIGLVGLIFALAATAQAHAVSISTGELQMDGPTAVFELRIPLYEVAQVAHPETDLLRQFRFGDGHLTRSSCQAQEGDYVCRGEYEFPGRHQESLAVECSLYRVTVPNHIHILTATQGANIDQEVFDQRFHAAEIRFHPPSRWQRLARDAGEGASRSATAAAGLLFLAGLALAARNRKEAFVLIAVFLAAEAAARPLGPRLPLALTARFLEAALALTVGYLAVEIVLLPEGRSRWAIVAALGLCRGFSLAGFPAAYLLGALPVHAAMFAALAVIALKMPSAWRRPAAGLLLAASLARFASQVWG